MLTKIEYVVLFFFFFLYTFAKSRKFSLLLNSSYIKLKIRSKDCPHSKVKHPSKIFKVIGEIITKFPIFLVLLLLEFKENCSLLYVFWNIAVLGGSEKYNNITRSRGMNEC